MSFEQIEHRVMQAIDKYDGGFGFLYIPREAVQISLEVAYKQGCIDGAEIAVDDMKKSFAAAVAGREVQQ